MLLFRYFLILCLLYPFQSLAQEHEKVCIPSPIYADVYKKLQKLDELETSSPVFYFPDPMIIVVDNQNRVYSNSTGSQKLPGQLNIGPLTYALQLEINLVVRKKEYPEGGFRFRPKFSTSLLPLNMVKVSENAFQLIDFGVDLEVVYYRHFNMSGYIGAQSFGINFGWEVFDNSGVNVGTKWLWPTSIVPPIFSPSVGWYFSF